MLSNAVIAAFGVVYKSDPPPSPRLRQGLYGERHGGIGKARRSESPGFFLGGGRAAACSVWRIAESYRSQTSKPGSAGTFWWQKVPPKPSASCFSRVSGAEHTERAQKDQAFSASRSGRVFCSRNFSAPSKVRLFAFPTVTRKRHSEPPSNTVSSVSTVISRPGNSSSST